MLDLFAGTGSLGIEAISRGASLTHFVDSNKGAIKIINENLKGVDENYKVYNSDYQKYLNETNIKYDIVLLDPPYKTGLGLCAIELLQNNNLLNKNAIIIFETSIDNDFILNYSNFEIIKKKYGSVLVYKLIKKD